MPAKLPVLRNDHTPKWLRKLALRCKVHGCRHRLRAIASVIEDKHSRAKIARRAAVDPQTLRDWVERYNNEGVDGLKTSPAQDDPKNSALTEPQPSPRGLMPAPIPMPESRPAGCWRTSSSGSSKCSTCTTQSKAHAA